MREPVRDKGRIEHILQAIDNIARFTEGVTYDMFLTDDILYYAIVKNIEIIGEAAYMISKEFKESHPEIEWNIMVRMRHVLVHGYYQLEKTEIWNTAMMDIPPLRQLMEGLSQSLD